MKMTELAERYCIYLELKGLSPGTYVRRGYVLRRAARLLSDPELSELTTGQLEMYLLEQKRAGYSKGCMRNLHIALYDMFRYAIKMGIVTANPLELIPREPQQIGRPRPVPKDTVERLLTIPFHVPLKGKLWRVCEARTEAMTFCALYGGLRVNEIRMLDIGDVDLKQNALHVRYAKGGKTRRVPIHPRLAAAIERYQLLRMELDNNPPSNAPLFAFKYKGVFRRGTVVGIQDAYQTWLKSIGADKSTMHQLRHTFATQLVRNKENLRTIQVLLGHSNIQTTQIYTGVDEETMEQAVKGLWS